VKYKLVPLAELGEIVSGSTPDTTNRSYWGGEIPWITPADLTDHQDIYLKRTLRKITNAGYQSCSTKMLPSGSILFSSRAPIGHCAVTTFPLCTNQGFKSIIPSTRLDSAYGYFALKYFTPQIQQLGRGATFTEINKELFEGVCIPLPPLNEQKRIGAILQKADRLRHLRRTARQLNDTFLQSVFLEMFGDPVTNPMQFPIVKFDDVCKSHLGKMLDAKQQTGKHKRPYLRNENVQWMKIDVNDVHEMDFDETDRAKYRLVKGDILICEGGEVGRSAIWNDELPECYFQKALHRARPDRKKALSEFVVWLMFTLAQNGGLGDFTSQVTIAHLTGVKLKTIEFPLPPMDLQEKFANTVMRHNKIQKQHLESERQAEHLFQSLLQRAFRGEI
jgi:type I restriction enzyme, S subunit